MLIETGRPFNGLGPCTRARTMGHGSSAGTPSAMAWRPAERIASKELVRRAGNIAYGSLW